MSEKNREQFHIIVPGEELIYFDLPKKRAKEQVRPLHTTAYNLDQKPPTLVRGQEVEPWSWGRALVPTLKCDISSREVGL